MKIAYKNIQNRLTFFQTFIFQARDVVVFVLVLVLRFGIRLVDLPVADVKILRFVTISLKNKIREQNTSKRDRIVILL